MALSDPTRNELLVFLPVQPTSSDTEIAHHPVLLMLDNVTMKHPVAGIIGDKGDLGRLVGQKQQRIGMMLGSAQLVRADQLEGVAVNMDRVGEGRFIPQGEDIGLPAIE